MKGGIITLFKKDNMKEKIYNKDNLYNNITSKRIILAMIFVAGFVVRLVAISKYPAGLNQDEASMGYDAYALLNYGIDRNGISYPVHFISWGSGQNALYAYLCFIPIKLFGLSEFSIRIPMALIGCISLVAVYIIAKYMLSDNNAIILTALFAICPWHIMKSRWALESNLFPDIILICVMFLVMYMVHNKLRYLILAAFLLGLSAYSYGTAYCFIPIFAIPVMIYLIKNKAKTVHVLSAVLTSFVVAFPMLLFVIINTFDMEPVNILIFTVPKLYVSRHMEITSVFSAEFFKLTFDNLRTTMDILMTGEDGLAWNSIRIYGIDYIITLPFTIIGSLACFAPRRFNAIVINRKCAFVINSWFVAAICASAIVEPNINRINILMIPIVIYSAIGIAYIIQKAYELRAVFAVIYITLFVLFIHNYFGEYNEGIKDSFYYSLGDAICFADRLDCDTVYVSENINMPYIYTLFYMKTPPEEYIDSVEYGTRYTAFEFVNSFDKYIFYNPYYINEGDNAAIIVENYNLNYINTEGLHVKSFEKYSVVYND